MRNNRIEKFIDHLMTTPDKELFMGSFKTCACSLLPEVWPEQFHFECNIFYTKGYGHQYVEGLIEWFGTAEPFKFSYEKPTCHQIAERLKCFLS